MADETWFSLEVIPEGWFAPELQPDGWFGKFLLDAQTSSGNISGTATLSFGQAGTLLGSTALSGAATLTFGQSGTLDAPTGAMSGTATLTFSQSGVLTGLGALSGLATLAFGQAGNLSGLSGDISGTATITFGQSGTLSDLNGLIVKQSGDDGAWMRRKKPIVTIRPKVESDLEEALETLENVRPSDRVATNKKKVRKALAVVKAIDPPPSYAQAIANIEASLKAVSRATAKHEGMTNALLTVAMDMQNLIAEMQRKRAEKRKRNLERVLWCL